MANDQTFQDGKPFHALKRKIGLAKSNYIEHKKMEVKQVCPRDILRLIRCLIL